MADLHDPKTLIQGPIQPKFHLVSVRDVQIGIPLNQKKNLRSTPANHLSQTCNLALTGRARGKTTPQSQLMVRGQEKGLLTQGLLQKEAD